MTEEREELIVLTDEDGNEEEFQHLDTFELNGNTYVVLVPDIEEDDIEEDEEFVVILRIEEDENGDDILAGITDENEIDGAFEEFQRRVNEEFDFTEDE